MLILAPGVTRAQLDDWLRSQCLRDLTQKGLLDPADLAKRVTGSRLAAPKPAPRPDAAALMAKGCWEKASWPSDIHEIAPPGRGYAGTGTAEAGQISLSTHSADPTWSHVVTSGRLTWNFGGRAHHVLCVGDVVSGEATFSNTGRELVRAGYSPSGSLKITVTGRQTAQLLAMSSGQLPEPGHSVTSPFRYDVEAGSDKENEFRIVAYVYAGRAATFTEVYRWTRR